MAPVDNAVRPVLLTAAQWRTRGGSWPDESTRITDSSMVTMLIPRDTSEDKTIQNPVNSMNNTMHDAIRNNGRPIDF